jgi:putative addiction module killer protein
VEFDVSETDTFTSWLDRLTDDVAVAAIAARIKRVRFGLFGDVKPVGEGVSELRVNHGPGYRVYFTIKRRKVIVLLCGGEKGSQRRDILEAKRLAKGVDDERED